MSSHDRTRGPRVNGMAMRRIRELFGISLTDMAERTGCGASHLSNVESGRRGISWKALRRFADETQTPIGAFLTDPSAEQDAA